MRSRSRALLPGTGAGIPAAILLLGAVFCFSQAGMESLAFRGMDIEELGRRAEQLKSRLDKDPANYEILRRLGTVRYYMAIIDSITHLKEAVHTLEQAHQANSHDSQVLCYLGSAYIITARDDSNPIVRINYIKKGLEFMDAAVENSPDDIVVRVIRGYTTMAMPAFLNRRSTAYKDFEYIAGLSEKRNRISPALRSEINGRLSDMYLQDGNAGKSAQYGALASRPAKMAPPSGRARAQEIPGTDLPSSKAREASAEQGLDDFLDGLFRQGMEKHKIPGAVFVLVKDGQSLTAKGYGYADLERRIPADPERSLFRIASVSKIFAHIALLQLADEGNVKLDAEVNRYLKGVQVRNPFSHPLAIANLLTHTDGFEERITRVFALSPETMPSLADVIRRDMQPLVNEPGRMITYGSFAGAVASYIVQQVSGQHFEDYVEEHILRPLGMTRTTLRQDLSPGRMDRIATVYQYKSGHYVPSPFLRLTTPATGGGVATAAEMGHLLVALLQRGRYGEGHILSEASADSLLQRQFTPVPGLPGVTYGFFEHLENGRRALVREGSGVGVNSRILLLPEKGMGFFVAYNTRGGEFSNELTSAILDRYFPEQPGVGQATSAGKSISNVESTSKAVLSSNPAVSLRNYAGTYRYVQYSRRTVAKLTALLMGIVRVRVNPEDQTITVTPLGMGDPYGGFEKAARFTEAKPGLFQREDGRGYIAFDNDGRSPASHLYSGMGYHGSFERLQWYQQPGFRLAVVGLLAVLFLAGVAGSFGPGRTVLAGIPGWAKGLMGLTSMLNLLILILIVPAAYILGETAGFPALTFVTGPHPLFTALVQLPWLIAVLTFGMIGASLVAWRDQMGFRAGRLYIALVTAGSAVFLGCLQFWNLWGRHW